MNPVMTLMTAYSRTITAIEKIDLIKKIFLIIDIRIKQNIVILIFSKKNNILKNIKIQYSKYIMKEFLKICIKK
jgi:hypothetical protein